MINNQEVYIEREFTFAELANMLGFESFEEEADLNIESLGIQVETPTGYSAVSEFYIKQKTVGYKLDNLIASGEHKTLVNGDWLALKNNTAAICLDKDIDVVDLFIPDGNCYIANGHVNHNTTPGGWSIS